MVRLKSRYLVARFAFKDGKLFSSSSSSFSSSSSSSAAGGTGTSLLEPASEAALLQPLRAALLATAGDAGAAASGPGGGLSVRAFDPGSGLAVVRCPRSSVATLRAAMACSMPAIAHRALRGGWAATLRVCGSAGAARRAAAKLVRAAPLLPPPPPPSSASPSNSGKRSSSERVLAAALRVREDALRRIAAFDA